MQDKLPSSKLIKKALQIATKAHQGQKRKDGNPYISHPIAVALLLARFGFDENTIAAALLHDTLEDTALTESQLREEIGDQVTDTVKALTQDESLTWPERKLKYLNLLRTSSDNVKAICTADKIHNLTTFLTWFDQIGPKIWESFTASRQEYEWYYDKLLDTLNENWEHPLLIDLTELIEEFKHL
jgi:(p)ppGpp synthase/HD superfamily hydrolase